MKCVSRSYWWLSRVLLSLASLLSAPQAHGVSADVYANPARWTDEGGNTMTLSTLRGQRTIFALFYSNCKTICPMTVKSLQELEKKLSGDVRFVLVTIDPEDHTPTGSQRIKDFIREQKISSRWKVLAADQANTRNLAAALGLGFADKPANGNLHNMHSLAVVAVKADGTVAGQEPLATLRPDKIRAWLSSGSK